MIRLFIILVFLYIFGMIVYIIYYNRNVIREQWNELKETFSSPNLKKNIVRGLVAILLKFLRKRIFKIWEFKKIKETNIFRLIKFLINVRAHLDIPKNSIMAVADTLSSSVVLPSVIFVNIKRECYAPVSGLESGTYGSSGLLK